MEKITKSFTIDQDSAIDLEEMIWDFIGQLPIDGEAWEVTIDVTYFLEKKKTTVESSMEFTEEWDD